MNPIKRPLTGLSVGLSISESDDSLHRGFPAWQVNRVTLQIVSALFGQGAGVVFGHDWREDGVMQAVHGFALQMQPPDPVSAEEARRADQPLLMNLLPWPDKPSLSEQDQARMSSTLRVESAGLPRELLEFEAKFRGHTEGSEYAYLRARGLTHLRHRLDAFCQARFCLGGRRSGSQGRFPGVIEEALLSVRDNRPLYLASLLGGATRQVIDAIEGKPMPEDFCQPTKVRELFASPPVGEIDPATQRDHETDPKAVWATFQEAGSERLLQNGLDESENAELFHTAVLDRAIAIVLTGLARLKRWTN
jgi:hypothetical protein